MRRQTFADAEQNISHLQRALVPMARRLIPVKHITPNYTKGRLLLAACRCVLHLCAVVSRRNHRQLPFLRRHSRTLLGLRHCSSAVVMVSKAMRAYRPPNAFKLVYYSYSWKRRDRLAARSSPSSALTKQKLCSCIENLAHISYRTCLNG